MSPRPINPAFNALPRAVVYVSTPPPEPSSHWKHHLNAIGAPGAAAGAGLANSAGSQIDPLSALDLPTLPPIIDDGVLTRYGLEPEEAAAMESEAVRRGQSRRRWKR